MNSILTFNPSLILDLPDSLATPAIPRRATPESAAFDIEAFLPRGPVELHPLQIVKIPTGLFLALPESSALLICSRSGLASKGVQVINAPGVIDSDYRDEVAVLLSYIAPPGTPPVVITHGMRIAQGLWIPINPAISFTPVSTRHELYTRPVERVGGFGSTGV